MKKASLKSLKIQLVFLVFCSWTFCADPIIDHHHEEESDEIATIKDENQTITEASPRFGNNSEEAEYLTIWETKCLSTALGDILTDKKDTGEHLDEPQEVEEKGDLYEQLERWALYQMKFFEKTDITPFLESIENQRPMKFIDHNLTPFVGAVIALLSFVFLFMIFFCVMSFSKKLSKWRLKRRNCCFKCCLCFMLIFVLIISILIIVNFVWIGKMYKIEEKLLCETTRVPHTLFFGNPEIHFEANKSSHFIGFERVRALIQHFLNESSSFTGGYNLKILQEIEDQQIKNEVSELESLSSIFFAKHSGTKGRDSSGNNRVPLSISYNLPLYKTKMDLLIEKYKTTTSHIHQISELSLILKDTPRAEAFIRNLKESHQDLLDLQIGISTFWNGVMTSTFDSTLGFKISVIALVVMSVLISLSLCANLAVFFKNVKLGKVKNKLNMRCLMILSLFIVFWGIMALFEVGRGIFSSIYGCSIMFQLHNDPFVTRNKLIPYLQKEEHFLTAFENCYFEPKKDSAENFLSIIPGQEKQAATLAYVSFLDGIKLIHEDTQPINQTTDIFHTDTFVNGLNGYKSGESHDFDDVFANLSILNYNFDCSSVYYSLTEKDCDQLPSGKTTCVKIKTGHYIANECNPDKNGESAVLFDNLKEYITREVIFIDNILNEVNGANNDEALLNKIKSISMKFEMIDDKVRALKSDLHTNFESMVKGRLEEWLDCSVVRDEVTKTFNSMCNHDTEKLMKFGDINFFIIFLSTVVVIGMFFLTFCLKEREGEKKLNKDSNPDLDNTFERDNVFNQSQDSLNIKYKDSPESPKNVEVMPLGDFGTFKNPEPKFKPAKGNRVTDNVGFGKLDEKDDFDDPFNQFLSLIHI